MYSASTVESVLPNFAKTPSPSISKYACGTALLIPTLPSDAMRSASVAFVYPFVVPVLNIIPPRVEIEFDIQVRYSHH